MKTSFASPRLGLLLLAASTIGAGSPARTGMPWVADDYTKAVAEARARHVPIFVEAWAPW